MHTPRRTDGYLLVTALLAVSMLMLLVTAYMFTSLNSPRTSRANADSLAGFLAAEGGLNLRAAQIRARFVNFERPGGSSVTAPGSCAGGSGDFVCLTYPVGARQVLTYVYETTKKNASGTVVESGTVAPGETYAGLSFQQYAYRVVSSARKESLTEANVEMEFQSRLVPLFQFAAFYTEDLEINPGPAMTLNGRVHTNKDLYLSPTATLAITGQTTAGGNIRRVRKDTGACNGGSVTFAGKPAPGCYTNPMSDAQTATYGGQVKVRQAALTVPGLDSLAPDRTGKGGSEMWTKADVRVVWNTVTNTAAVQRPDGSLDVTATTALQSCGAVSASSSFFDSREKRSVRMMDIDQAKLMACIQSSGKFTAQDGQVLTMDDRSGGGLALHFSFNPESGAPNTYGVRVQNGAKLGPPGGPAPRGLSFTTDQPLYVQGSYNSVAPVPASLMGDTINVLSGAWKDGVKTASNNKAAPAAPTEIHAAFLGGTDTTASGNYNGGLENYPRFHENWSGVPFKYVGSFVSLGEPKKAQGDWKNAVYSPPNRDWSYDTQFNSADKLPPLTPRFVYLRQLFFAREF